MTAAAIHPQDVLSLPPVVVTVVACDAATATATVAAVVAVLVVVVCTDSLVVATLASV
ncbi:MAG TPA: hypothetical protein VFD90_05145 [Gaiellales bacterium]|jgi:hypothetical protein|nr:hypothetical protein [Gaiellales bacterium]